MWNRLIENRVKDALSDTPVILITGPRRSGKTTLVKKFQTSNGFSKYVTFDDDGSLATARDDPNRFILDADRIIIDEIQKAPWLFSTIKKSVDEDYRPGRFLLTGSANLLQMPQMADSMVGRMERINLLPLAQSELIGVQPTFLDRLFAAEIGQKNDKLMENAVIKDDLIRVILRGGYPEAIKRSEHRRMLWCQSYLEIYMERDFKDIAVTEKLVDLPVFIEALGAYSGKLFKYSQLPSNGIGVSHPTAKRYAELVERLYLVSIVRNWNRNVFKRLNKTPKLYFFDTGLLAMVNNLTLDRFRSNRSSLGPLLETFVFSEVQKLLSVSDMWIKTYHFRNSQNKEVDIVLERSDGCVAGIEVKASSTIQAHDFDGLRTLAETCGENFVYGVVLYDGLEHLQFGDDMSAAPLSILWN